ncbi:polyribonucleotide nucleotidyltransferase [Rhodothermus bifroesti]|nr:Polyribonucleotide nucleotidyltransferase [bacterium HR18]
MLMGRRCPENGMEMMMQATFHEIEFAPGKTLRLETGRLAKQANGAVVVRQGDTMVLCTAVLASEPRPGVDFFPLTVEYREKFAAGGKIPGGFIKREGRPSDKEILSSRLIDRAIRPLFPEGFLHEVQIICYVISADDRYDADVLAGTGASAALLLAGAPFDGPIAEVRVGRIDGQFVVNPTLKELEQSDMNLVVAGKEDAIVMVEGELKEVSEADVLEALEVAHEAIRKLCQGQRAFVEAYGHVEPFAYTPVVLPEALLERVRELAAPRLEAHLRAPYEKQEFYEGLERIGEETLTALLGTVDAEGQPVLAEATPEGWTADQIRKAVVQVTREVMRQLILREGRRIDGRGLEEIRPIWMEVGYLPRVHGSAIFTRGETQVLASVTLGTSKDVQLIDQIFVTGDKRFFLHYEFPPFCTGEVRPLRGPGRREVGHGYLAERALAAVLPDEASFPYTIRISADVLESNGSSSMASVCAGSLALMDAGVPVKKHVAGVAMGLIKEGDQVAVLTDILGTEDHLGDMDFKVAGTRDGITACQMDIKISGLTREILQQALEQARRGRLYILDLMEQTIEAPRPDLSPYAPRLTQITIDAGFIGAVIGPGGRVVQGIQRETNTTIEIEERDGVGVVTIAATNQENAQRAIERIKQIVAVPEVGAEYEGIVRSIQSFGAIVEIMPGKEGLLHISELDYGYVKDVHDYLKVGDKVRVKLIEIRDDGKLRLSRKAFLPPPEATAEAKNGEPEKTAAAARKEPASGGATRGGGRSGGVHGRGPGRGRGGHRR